MTILDSYIIRRLLVITLFAILVFTISWLAPELMFKAVKGIAKNRITVEQGIAYLIYQVPEILTYCLPISGLFATVFLFRQLSLSSELVAILSSGIAFKRLLIPVGIVGLGISLLFFVTQEFLIPHSAARLTELRYTTKFDDNDLVTPQVTYVEKSRTGAMEKFLIISPKAAQDQNKFIFLFYRKDADETYIHRIITATAGDWDKQVKVWVLRNGIQYLLNPAGIYRQVMPFERLNVKTSAVPYDLLSFPTGNPGEFTIRQLARYVRLLHRGGQTEDARFYEVRLYQRFFLPWMPFVFTLLGAVIGIERTRAKRNLGLTYAAVLLLVYNILVPVSTTLGSLGMVPALLAAPLPLIIAGLGGGAIIKLRRSEG